MRPGRVALSSRKRLDRRDAELALLDRSDDERAELVRRVHARAPRVLRCTVRRFRLVAREVGGRILDPLAVLVDRRAEMLDLLEPDGFRRAGELVTHVDRRRREPRLPGGGLHFVALVVVDVDAVVVGRGRWPAETLLRRHQQQVALVGVDEERTELIVDPDAGAARETRRARKWLDRVAGEMCDGVGDALGVLVRWRAEVLHLAYRHVDVLELIDEVDVCNAGEGSCRLYFVAEKVIGARRVRRPGADVALAAVRRRAGVAVVARGAVRCRAVGRAVVVDAVARLGDVTGSRRRAAGHAGVPGRMLTGVAGAVALVEGARVLVGGAREPARPLGVGRAARVAAGAGVRHVALAGRRPADRRRGGERVGRTIVLRTNLGRLPPHRHRRRLSVRRALRRADRPGRYSRPSSRRRFRRVG